MITLLINGASGGGGDGRGEGSTMPGHGIRYPKGGLGGGGNRFLGWKTHVQQTMSELAHNIH